MSDGEVVDVEPQEAESVERKAERFVQFVFDEKATEFKVPWTLEQVTGMVNDVMKDDGYLWVPRDEERGTGTFINLKNCTCVKIVEREVAAPLPPQAPDMIPEPESEPPIEDRANALLDGLSERVSLFDKVFDRGASTFVPVILERELGVSQEDARRLLDEWRSSQQ